MASGAVLPLVVSVDRYAGTILRSMRHRVEHVRDAWALSGLQPSMAVDLVPAVRRLVAARRLVRRTGPVVKRRQAGGAEAQARRAIAAYLAAQPPVARRQLRRMRAAIRGAAPGAVEHFSYRIPGFKLDGRPLVWYAGFRNHTSMYPMGEAIRRALGRELADYETSKGTIRFPFANSPSVALIRKLVKARIVEVRKPKPARRT
jgi:uncharacterized protein YdhG (YjbR/CyaY superfamily)